MGSSGQPFLVSDDLESLEADCSGSMWDAPVLEFVSFVLMIRLGLWACRGEDHRGTVPSSSHLILGLYHQHDCHLLTWLSMELSDFSTRQLLFSTPFQIVLCGGKLLCAAQTQGVGIYVLTPCGQSIYLKYLEFFHMGDLPLIPLY